MPGEVWVGPASAPDTYRLLSLLGGGGEGDVWKAELPLSTEGRRIVAVKIVRMQAGPAAERLWERSGHLLRGLSHPGLVRVTDVFRGPLMHTAGQADAASVAHYVVMDHVEGPTLAQWLSDRPGASARERLATLRTVAEALDEMHSGASTQVPVAHGDVKPANVVVRPNGTAVLVDLGLTRLTDATGMVGRSAPYAAPEMRGGLPQPTPEGDAFAFVATVAQTLTGRRPPTDGNGWLDLRALESELRASPVVQHRPVAVRYVIEALLAPPSARPHRLRTWLEVVDGALQAGAGPSLTETADPEPTTEVVAPDPEAPPDPAEPPAERSRTVSVGLIVVSVLATVVLVVSVVLVLGMYRAAPVAAPGAEIFREPVGPTGPDPFTASVVLVERPLESPPLVDPAPGAGGVQARGESPGLYGGVRRNGTCDAGRLGTLLPTDPAKAAAWAGVLGIRAGQIPDYVAALTPVVLRADTRVTNHGYRDGGATTRQSTLQAGTAVLVDRYGVPRVRCGSGNPLTEPAPQPTTVTYRGAAWLGAERPPLLVVPAPNLLDHFTLVDVSTGRNFDRPVGTNGPADSAASR
jgi:hypothetical protein